MAGMERDCIRHPDIKGCSLKRSLQEDSVLQPWQCCWTVTACSVPLAVQDSG